MNNPGQQNTLYRPIAKQAVGEARQTKPEKAAQLNRLLIYWQNCQASNRPLAQLPISIIRFFTRFWQTSSTDGDIIGVQIRHQHALNFRSRPGYSGFDCTKVSFSQNCNFFIRQSFQLS